MLRDAQTRFEKTLELDPDSTARPLLEEVQIYFISEKHIFTTIFHYIDTPAFAKHA